MKKTISLFVACFALFTAKATERKDYLLNDNWKFTFNYEVEKSAGIRVDIPHTWNNMDALNGQLDYYRGAAIYKRKLEGKKEWKGQRLFLKFDGVNTIANVFINGKHLGEHRGGYTAFVFEITKALNYDGPNEIMVRVSNALNLDVMPLTGDFNFYGGIFRDVHLLMAPQNCISPLDYASSGVYISQKKVTKQEANVSVKVLLDHVEPVEAGSEVQINIINNKQVIASKSISIKKGITGKQEINADFSILNPRLWNGRKDPFMYKTEVSIKTNKQIQDQVIQPLGLRYFNIDANNGFFLNGEHIKLKGVCRHEDYNGSGNALLPWQQEEDINIIKEMGANAIRLSHYPQSPYFYKLLNESGIITWSEIPFVGPGGYNYKGFVDQPSFRENGKTQLIEMIRQNYNQPGILVWGLYNELNLIGDNPVEFVHELNKLAHQEDPYRPTVSANNVDDQTLTHITDLAAWNKYFGWYGGNPKEIGNWADKLHQESPSLRLAISEYGAGASIYHHEDTLKKPEAKSYWHPEAWQAYYHEENWKAINERPYIWGSFIWNLFDFGASHRREGDRDGKNDKGLVTYDRKIKKDAWWFYKASWVEDEPVLHLNNQRFLNRTNNLVNTVKAYTNLPEIELFINGKSKGKVKTANATAMWNNVMLDSGENIIEVRGTYKNQTIKDSCNWFLQ
jgi:beta-galactosidase